MTAIGSAINPVLFDEPLMGMVSRNLPSGINSSVSNLIKSDILRTGNISNGSIPAVREGLLNRVNGSASSFLRGAKNVTTSAVNSTISATKEVGNVIANDVLPKPEPFSSTLMRNKFLSVVLVGGFINGMRGISKVIAGEASSDQLVPTVVKETTMGAIGGVSFAGGMSATASLFGKFMGRVPLSIAGLTVGALAAIGVTELVKATVPAFQD